MPRKVLVVDDNVLNREMLKHTLLKDYDVLEAGNGKEALSLMHRNYKMLSAVLLDIVMPEMDGYEVLRAIGENPLLSQIPVIMVTGSGDEASRVKALSLGANDFISKPFNPDIIRHCLRNNIALRETASILNAIQRDKLTGLYNREAFFDKVTSLIREREPGYYILSCFDIDNFKLINDQFGAAEGDRILRGIGATLREEMNALDGFGGRISGDNFAILFPARHMDADIAQRLRARNASLLERQSMVFSIGRYVITDTALSASAIYDRAYIAKQSVKGRYDKHLAYFDERMLKRLVLNQQITGEMEAALIDRQFEVWFQPQYDHEAGRLIGAEALARWRHPRKGIVPPMDFIPLFEETGFVYELDRYVWREVCRYLRKWMDEGRNPLPVSVNVSRYDIFRSDLIEVITGLVDEFRIPPDLLRLEITESAFSISTEAVVSIVKRLIALGFTIEIDDFGSGYSSLNTLKNVPAQVVKLDMRFLEDDGGSQRGGNILESVVRMTKWLGMTVLAEGVEEKDQADFLKSIGCTYVQGYLYSRAVPAEAYEALCEGDGTLDMPPMRPEGVSGWNGAAFWNPKSIDSLIFNSFSGGACVYEYRAGRLELIRVAEAYARKLFGSETPVEGLMKIDWLAAAAPESAQALKEAIEASVADRTEVAGEYRFLNLPGCREDTYLRTSLRVIASADDRHLLYCVSENVTEQRQAEKRMVASAEQLQAILDNVTAGIAAVAMREEGPQLVFSNDMLYRVLDCPRDRFVLRYLTAPDDALPEELVQVRRTADETGLCTMEYRVPRGDGAVIWVSHRMRSIRVANIDAPIRLSVLTDITASKLAGIKVAEAEARQSLLINSILGGIATYEGEPGIAEDEPPRLRLTYFSDGVCRLFGYTREEYQRLAEADAAGLIFRQDLPEVLRQAGAMLRRGEPMDCTYRVHAKGGGYRWIQHKSVLRERRGETAVAYSVLTDVTAQQDMLERLRISEEENRLSIAQSGTIVCRYTIADQTLDMPPALAAAFALPDKARNVPEEPVRRGLIAPETAEAYTRFFEEIRRGEPSGSVAFQQKYEGEWRWMEARASTVFSDDGKPVKAVISFMDITELLEKEAVYTRWQQSLHKRDPNGYSLLLLSVSRESVLRALGGALISAQIPKGALPFDEYVARYAAQRVFSEDAQRFTAALNANALLAAYYQGMCTSVLDYRETLSEGGFRWLRLTADLVRTPHSMDVGAYLLFEDIDAAKRAELAAIERAENDPLTGILNRTAFAEKANARMRSSKPSTQHALLMLDIDGFKLVNDAFGHAAGDQTLIDVARGLRAILRRDDLVGRLGGDEFVVFLNDIPNGKIAADKARQICEITRKTYSAQVRISASVGVALCPGDGADFDTLYKKADAALYSVKGSGRNGYAFYHDNMEGGRASAGERPETAEKREPVKRRQRHRMLIVDDNRMDCQLLANMFREEFIVEKAMDGNTALILMRHYGSALSVVLLDLLMPGVDGFAVLDRMRQSAEMRSIPVVVVSAADDRETSLRAIRAGAADFISKPIDAEILRIRVQSAVSKAENERLRAKNSYLEVQSGETAAYRAVLDGLSIAMTEVDWGKDSFTYSPTMAKRLAGRYDGRSLWHILLSDFVADAQTVKRLQETAHAVAEDRSRARVDTRARLKAADGVVREFDISVYKLTNEFALADKLVLTFREISAPAEPTRND